MKCLLNSLDMKQKHLLGFNLKSASCSTVSFPVLVVQ